MVPRRLTVDSMNDGADRASFAANKEQNTFFLELVLREVTNEGFRGVSLSMNSWSQVITEFNEKYHTNYRQRTFKNRFDYLRALYGMWRKLVSISGHGLSADINTLTWPEEKWNELKEKYPDEVEKFKNKPLPDAELLINIFEGTLAKGDQAWTHLSLEPCPNDVEPMEGFTRQGADDEDPYFQGWSMERNLPDTPGAHSDAGTSRPVKATSQSSSRKRRREDSNVEEQIVRLINVIETQVNEEIKNRPPNMNDITTILVDLESLGVISENMCVEATFKFSLQPGLMTGFMASRNEADRVKFIKLMLGIVD